MALDNFRTIELIWDKANKSIIKTIKTASSDTTGRYLSVKILDGGQEVTLNNAKLQLYWEHPNFNTSGTDDFNTVNNGGLFKMAFSEEMLTNIGELNAHLVLTLPDGKITSNGFPIEVFKGTNGGVVVPSNGDVLFKQIDTKIDKGNVTLNDLTQEVKLAMTGGSVAVVGVDAVGTENVKDNSITPEKTSFVNRGKNIFNKYNLESGKVIVPSTGILGANASYATTGFEQIGGNVIITQNQSWIIAFYDGDKNFISSQATVSPPTESKRTLTTPANANYFRTSVSNAQIDNYQIEINSTSTEYESFKYTITGFATEKDVEQDALLDSLYDDKNYNLKYFTKYKESPEVNKDDFKILQSFQYARIEGSNADFPHQLRYMARGIPTYGHRFIIERFNGSAWEQIIDTTTAVQVEENNQGVTVIKYANANYKVEFHIDFRLWPQAPFSKSFNNPLADPNYVFSGNAFSSSSQSSGGGSGEAYDQRLNSTDDVTFKTLSTTSVNADVVAIGGTIPTGTLTNPPTNLVSGDVWADTTDSATQPILRVML